MFFKTKTKTYRIYMFSKNKHIDSICFIDKHIESTYFKKKTYRIYMFSNAHIHII